MKKIFMGFLIVLFLAGLLAGCGVSDEVARNDPPTVISTAPAADAINVATNINKITATFNKGMESSSITSAGTFTLTGPDGAVAGLVTYVEKTDEEQHFAIFTPTTILPSGVYFKPGGTYTATITTAAKDRYGNALAATKTWSFTIGLLPALTDPVVTSISPAAAATVKTDTDINVTFSAVMDPETVNIRAFKLQNESLFSASVPGIVTYNGSTATFNPLVNLVPNNTYKVMLTNEVKDLVGNPLVPKEWQFKTD
jgi:hypothetical protein